MELPQVLVNLPTTDVPRCTSSSAKTLGLNHLQLPDMGTGGEPADWAPVVHHGTLFRDTTPRTICLVYILMGGLARGWKRANMCRWAECEDCVGLICR